MIRIRKHNQRWEIRELRFGRFSWNACNETELLHRVIINKVVELDFYIKLALEVISGKSEIYLYQEGILTRRNLIGKVSCLTPFIQQRAKLETIIYMIEAGIWRVREWKTPECLAHFPELSYLPEIKVKKNYLILDTIDDDFMPSDLEFINISRLKSKS